MTTARDFDSEFDADLKFMRSVLSGRIDLTTASTKHLLAEYEAWSTLEPDSPWRMPTQSEHDTIKQFLQHIITIVDGRSTSLSPL